MFKGHLEGIVAESVETIAGATVTGLGAYCLVADIDPGCKAGKVDVYPIRVLWQGIEITTVFYDVGVDGIFECVGESGLVECLVLMCGEVYLKVASSFRSIYAIAGKQEGQQQKGEAGIGRLWIRH
jgi:hypothetical protein